MKAIILAAGQGKRLLPLTERVPKSMMRVGSQTIIEHILDRLVRCHIQDIVIVVGHYGQSIIDHIGSNHQGARVSYIHNEEYGRTNNIYSLWLAREPARDGCLIINGDNLFNVHILSDIIDSPYADAAAIDDSVTDLPEEAMKVTMENGRLVNVSKGISREMAHGDAIGIYKFSREGAHHLFEEIRKLIMAEQKSVFYLGAMANLVQYHPVYAVSTKKSGTGLGTKIVKDVVDAHKGTITVESEVGKGTTFRLRLPRDPARTHP